ncbi:hypothetical protein Poly30_33450 [Planctomycetes bacterium Poly30]|uniref:FG-GAP repeat protein n=1 Tax=Saltatorellus ferox TaxID=2528018 RepID=A0A518EUP5_9BACT|nr:hypothetical protein Poly30_33450 [Planctomycetes bacterium Poly30]
MTPGLATRAAALPLLAAAFLHSSSEVSAWPHQGGEGSTAPEAKELSADDWSGIRAAYDRERHAFFATEEGHAALLHGQGCTAHFDGQGAWIEPGHAGWSLGLSLARYGFEGEFTEVQGTHGVRPEGQRLTYDWGETLSEWWINDTRGLEHGFTVHERPPGSAGAADQPLVFEMAVRGDLRAIATFDRRGVRFVDEEGEVRSTYEGLVAYDADGVPLQAWIDTTGAGFRIAVCEGTARYPLTVDPIVQAAYLKSAVAEAGDNFGISADISGDTVVVGAWGEDGSSTGVNGNQADNGANFSGAAYVFVRSGGTWSQEAYLKASNTGQSDYFGFSVGISRDTIVVGAYGEDSDATGINGNQSSNAAQNAGAAYIFQRTGTTWTQQAYLKASNTDVNDKFGHKVAITGGTVIVSAENEQSSATGVDGDQLDNSAGSSGAAYIFHRSGTRWSQQAYLKASNTEPADYFGAEVALSGDTAVVSSLWESSGATGVNGDQSDNSVGTAGAVYVFHRTAGVWSQQAYLKPSNTMTFHYFGYSVGISGDTIAIGALGDRSDSTGVNGSQADVGLIRAGAAYIFQRTGGVWRQEAYMKTSNPEYGDELGRSIAISGDVVVAGAIWEDSAASGVNGDQSDNSRSDAGAAYLYHRSEGVWTQRAYLKASNPGGSDLFGYSVAISGGTVLIATQGEDSNATGVNGNGSNNSAGNAGAAYIFNVGGLGNIGVSICAPGVPNSTGLPAELAVRGSSVALDNQVELFARNLPLGNFGYFLTSRTYGPPATPMGSQGAICLDGSIGRYIGPGQIRSSGSSGTFALSIDLTQTPQPSGFVSVLAGETWSFQAWYRDAIGGQVTSNFTDGVELTFR